MFFIFSKVTASEECIVVAIVFDTKICQSDISKKNKSVKDELLKNRKKTLAYKIRTIGIENLLQKENYTPQKNEIDAFIKYKNTLKTNETYQAEKIVNTINSLLEKNEYDEKNRTRLEEGLKTYQYVLKEKERDDERKKSRYEDYEKKGGKELAIKMQSLAAKREAERPTSFAINMIKIWKLNKAIFEEYGGGKVVFHQFAGVIEPIDAYRLLIKDIKSKGKLTIATPKFKNLLLAPEDYYNKGLRITETRDTFPLPYWEKPIDEQKYINSINHYNAIPIK